MFRDGVALGTTLLPNLTLNMGDNILTSEGNFKVNSVILFDMDLCH